MTKPLLERLAEKSLEAAKQLTDAKKDRERLLAELELTREESRRARRILREYDELLKERKKVQQKLEQMLKKLDGLMV
ncbi:MAG TPA: hypothetical protein P5079_08870 [Elusimicrobiota bacterium]|nr:hypothetical protein [Elusimicrobiota bacterium]